VCGLSALTLVASGCSGTSSDKPPTGAESSDCNVVLHFEDREYRSTGFYVDLEPQHEAEMIGVGVIPGCNDAAGRDREFPDVVLVGRSDLLDEPVDDVVLARRGSASMLFVARGVGKPEVQQMIDVLSESGEVIDD